MPRSTNIPLLIGVTGSMGAGKSTVASLLAKHLKAPLANADTFARDAVKKGSGALTALIKLCGPSIVTKSGTLDRKKFAAVFFSSKRIKSQAEKIIHAEVRRLLISDVQTAMQRGARFFIYDVPLLFEAKGLQELIPVRVVVTCPASRAIARAAKRLGISPAEVKKRRASQLSEQQKIARADIVIDNDGTPAQLKTVVKQVARFIEQNL